MLKRMLDAGPIDAIDAQTKWSKVNPPKSTSAITIINILCDIFFPFT
jgi:hypothetical protein